jgi:hypothetical protein
MLIPHFPDKLVRSNGGPKAFMTSQLRSVFCISWVMYLSIPHAASHRLDRLRSSLRN